jgi:hypothetical protein
VEFCTDGSTSVFGCKRGFQVLIKKGIAPNVTGLRYVNIRQVFAAKTLKQIVSYDTPAVFFLIQCFEFKNFLQVFCLFYLITLEPD